MSKSRMTEERWGFLSKMNELERDNRFLRDELSLIFSEVSHSVVTASSSTDRFSSSVLKRPPPIFLSRSLPNKSSATGKDSSQPPSHLALPSYPSSTSPAPAAVGVSASTPAPVATETSRNGQSRQSRPQPSTTSHSHSSGLYSPPQTSFPAPVSYKQFDAFDEEHETAADYAPARPHTTPHAPPQPVYQATHEGPSNRFSQYSHSDQRIHSPPSRDAPRPSPPPPPTSAFASRTKTHDARDLLREAEENIFSADELRELDELNEQERERNTEPVSDAIGRIVRGVVGVDA